MSADYFDKFTDEENINNFLAFENYLIELGEKSDLNSRGIESTNSDTIDDPKFNQIVIDDMDKYKSRTKRVLNGNRSNSTVRILYDSFLSYGNECEMARTKVARFLMDYLRVHMEELSTRGPSKRVNFLTSDKVKLFDAFGIDQEKIKEIIRKTDRIKSTWIICNDPANMILALSSVYYWSHMTDQEKKATSYKNTLVFMTTLLLVLKFYSSLQYKYFKYGTDEEEMNALLDEMSGRFGITKFNSMYEYLEYCAYTNVKNSTALMDNPIDDNICYFIQNLNSRINSMIKGIASAFHERRASGKKVAIDTLEKTNSEGDRYMEVNESISSDISLVTRKILLKLTQDSSVNDKLLAISCKQTKVSVSKMKISIQDMIDTDKDIIGKLISLIISYYLGTLKKPKNTIRSINFITIMKKVYGISNTNSDIVMNIKDILETLMKKHSKEYLKTNRVATLSNLRATCYYYWVLYINAKCE